MGAALTSAVVAEGNCEGVSGTAVLSIAGGAATRPGTTGAQPAGAEPDTGTTFREPPLPEQKPLTPGTPILPVESTTIIMGIRGGNTCNMNPIPPFEAVIATNMLPLWRAPVAPM